jgi:hypothetical protein
MDFVDRALLMKFSRRPGTPFEGRGGHPGIRGYSQSMVKVLGFARPPASKIR